MKQPKSCSTRIPAYSVSIAIDGHFSTDGYSACKLKTACYIYCRESSAIYTSNREEWC
jgi:hypothetical protein